MIEKLDTDITENDIIALVAESLYLWDRELFNRTSDCVGAARVAYDTMKQISEKLGNG